MLFGQPLSATQLLSKLKLSAQLQLINKAANPDVNYDEKSISAVFDLSSFLWLTKVVKL
jgi:hypothetical protein